jgi:hypothetical protein
VIATDPCPRDGGQGPSHTQFLKGSLTFTLNTTRPARAHAHRPTAVAFKMRRFASPICQRAKPLGR